MSLAGMESLGRGMMCDGLGEIGGEAGLKLA